MSFLEDFLAQLQQGGQAAFPNSGAIGHRMGGRNLAYFGGQQPPQDMLAPLPGNAPMPTTVMKDGKPSFSPIPPQPPQQPSQLAQLPSPQASQEPQSQVEAPYNMLERIFLGAGGQGAAVKADKERYEFATMIEKLPSSSKNPVLETLKQAAMKNPEKFGEAYLKAAMEGGTDVKGEMDLRKEFDALGKDFRTVKDAYTRVEASAVNPSAAGDLALLFSFMKILDPGTGVKEGEYANAENSAGVPERIRAQYNKAINGERLTDQMRNDFVSRARGLYQSQAVNYNQTATQYRGLGTSYGYEPDRIAKLVDLPKPPAAPPGGLAALPALPATATREQKMQRLQQLKAMKAQR